MKKLHKFLKGTVLACILGALLVGEAMAQDPGVEEIAGKGQVDWVRNTISAKGLGIAPPSALNAAQARALAQRAAVVDARRNLLEVLKGVHIDSSTTVENFLVTSDTVRTRVEGVLQGSMVDGYVQQPDGSFEASVSIALDGNLGDVLVPMVMGLPVPNQAATPIQSRTPLPIQDVEQRLDRLEQRIDDLEQKLSAAQNVSLEQEQMLQMFLRLVAAWNEYAGHQFQALPVANTPDASMLVHKMKIELERQGRALEAMQAKLDGLIKRIGAEAQHNDDKTLQLSPRGQSSPYTGLVVDASGTGFLPCLRPSIYSESKTLYPGSYIDVGVAASRGFVRYYRNLDQAQRSVKAGNLPYTAKALGTGKKRRSLKLRPNDAKLLQSVLEAPDNFLAKCQVAIVF